MLIVTKTFHKINTFLHLFLITLVFMFIENVFLKCFDNSFINKNELSREVAFDNMLSKKHSNNSNNSNIAIAFNKR
ncbi:hypothetical protein MGAS2096_Spy0632 [Streptococcus pyogenes MGAS2096]|nr:hypothetical protein MGAS2096_Spy0632 [Streptococcus pyogenes MGAS2096]